LPFPADITSRLDALSHRKRSQWESQRPSREDRNQEKKRREDRFWQSLSRFPQTQVLESPEGRVLYRKTDALTNFRMAPAPFGELEEPFAPEAIGNLGAGLGECPPFGEAAFFDTETTGLMGGAGTVIFLVGIGYWEQKGGVWQFCLEQFWIDDFCHERALMTRLAARLSSFRILVSYNGKSFDIPLLKNRLIMNRLETARACLPHIDLLHAARRIWRDRLESLSLKNVERHVLDIDRGEDIDSASIPEKFAETARSGEMGSLKEVLHHHGQDIVSLASLLRRISGILRDPVGSEWLHRAEDCACLARWLEKNGQHEESLALLEKARRCETGLSRTNEKAWLWRYACLNKKMKRWEEAVEAWEQLAKGSLRQSFPAWIELAKYFEHREKNYAKARDTIARCLKQIELERQLRAHLGRESGWEEIMEYRQEMSHRLVRIQSKAANRSL